MSEKSDSRAVQSRIEEIKAAQVEPVEKVAQHLEDYKETPKDEPVPENLIEEQKDKTDSELHDEIDSLYYGDSYSQYSGDSRRTGATNATYISRLEKELEEEKHARERLEKELEEIKKISSEISSHLGLNVKM